METKQIIYPVSRLLANPRVFMAIANEFDGPDWELIASAFYDLLEHDILDIENSEDVIFESPEVCFREKPENIEVLQIVLSNGNAIELHPSASSSEDGEEYYSAIKTEEEFAITSTINARLVRAIEEAAPEIAGDVALCEPPTPANEFLRDSTNDCFRGKFHLMSDPEKMFDFHVEIIDLSTDELKASIRPL